MNANRLWLVLILTVLWLGCAGAAWAQAAQDNDDAAEPEPTAEVAEDSSTDDALADAGEDDEADEDDDDSEPDPEDFDPTEDIIVDSEIAFPVDI